LDAALDDAVFARGALAEEAAELLDLGLGLLDLLGADGLLQLERLVELLVEAAHEPLAFGGVGGAADAGGELERLPLEVHLALDLTVERVGALGELPEERPRAGRHVRP